MSYGTRNLDVRALELALLTLWKDSGVVDKVYRYKYRIKILAAENRVSTELFYDMSCGGIFSDIIDIASVSDSCPEDYAVDLQTLLAARGVVDGVIQENEGKAYGE